jgi:hypothetical protein
VLSKRPGIDPNWLRYDYEAMSILTNFAVTIGAMLLVTALEHTRPEERARTAKFFERLETPIDLRRADAPTPSKEFSPFPVMGWITAATGAMLWGAAALQAGGLGRTINLGAGFVLILIGAGFHVLHRRVARESQGGTHAD